jgi:hypothetical protein
MSYSQLKCTNDNFTKFKLDSLNLMRKIAVLESRLSTYKRFRLLITNNDIPRIQQLMQACIRQGNGMNYICEKIKKASEGVYRPEGYNENYFDLATLVLRIGGPRLLYVFNQQNMLPCASYMYKILKTDLSLVYTYSNFSENKLAIKNNINEFINEFSKLSKYQ